VQDDCSTRMGLMDAHRLYGCCRGYTPFAEETLDPERQSKGDTKEGFYFGRQGPASVSPLLFCRHTPAAAVATASHGAFPRFNLSSDEPIEQHDLLYWLDLVSTTGSDHCCPVIDAWCHINREVPKDSPEAALPLHGPNQWPSEQLLPGFKDAITSYSDAVTNLGRQLLRLLALSLQLPADFFNPHFTTPMIALRPLHYSAEVGE